jgi:hypothetical protein
VVTSVSRRPPLYRQHTTRIALEAALDGGQLSVATGLPVGAPRSSEQVEDMARPTSSPTSVTPTRRPRPRRRPRRLAAGC